MRSKLSVLVVVGMLIQSSFMFCLMVTPSKATQQGHVCISVGPHELYLTIQEGINVANDGDIVMVESGYTYYENVIVNKSIELSSMGDHDAVIDGSGSGSVVTLVVDHVNLNNFTIQNSGSSSDDAGVKLYSSNYSNITDNIIYGNYYGIVSYCSSHNNFNNNEVFTNEWAGINIASSENNTFYSNDIYENLGAGISFYLAANNTISLNNIFSNDYSGISLEDSNNLTITLNTIYNNLAMGIYNILSLENTISSNVIGYNTYGIYVDTSNNCTITLNDIYNNSYDGIHGNFLQYSSISLNTIFNNSYSGIGLYTSAHINISENFIFNNSLDGINITYSNYNTISSNEIFNNTWNGICVQRYSSYNTILKNTVHNNEYTGIEVETFSTNNTVFSNDIYNNSMYAILVYYGSNDTIMDSNIVYDNHGGGIVIGWWCYNNTITSNVVQNNSVFGIDILLSRYNIAYNNYIDNPNNVYDNSYTIWNTSKTSGSNIVGGSWFGGNYWSNYTGHDIDHDSIGDTLLPYDNGGKIQNGGDYLPLVISPEVVSVSPLNGATNVPISTRIIFTFSKLMNEISVILNFSTSPSISGTYITDDSTFIMIPTSNLGYGTTITARIDWNATDEDGNVMTDNYTWSFTTEQRSSGGSGSGEDPSSNSAPNADAGGPYHGYVNQSIRFDGTGSSDPDEDNLTYHWVFGDGRTGSGVTPTHTYTRTGNYTVILTVSDGELNDTDTTIATVTQLPEGTSSPVADAGGPYRGLSYQNIVFDASNSYDADGSIISYQWNFGDGTTSSEILLKHHYNQSGVYNVTLVVTDDDGFTDSDKTTALIILDSDGDGISDEIEITLGLDPHNATEIQEFEIGGTPQYLVDRNGDGILDSFYNTNLEIYTPLGTGPNGEILIDYDGNGHWDYFYNSATGEVLIYQSQPSGDLLQLLTVVGIVAAVIVSLSIVIWIYKDQKGF